MPAADPGRAGLALHLRLRRALHQQPRRAATAHGQTADEDRRLLAQRTHRRPLLPHPLLPRHRPQPRHPPTRCPPRHSVREPLDATTKRLINHRREWIPSDQSYSNLGRCRCIRPGRSLPTPRIRRSSARRPPPAAVSATAASPAGNSFHHSPETSRSTNHKLTRGRPRQFSTSALNTAWRRSP